jgi:hypothetical protein
MVTYSSHCSENKNRNCTVNKSGTQREDTETGRSCDEYSFCMTFSILSHTGNIALTWVVYVAETATLKQRVKMQVKFNK